MATATKAFVFHPIGTLYGRWAFNFMVEIATAVAHDFTERPQHYRQVSDELVRILIGFRSSMGSHPDWPDTQQRTTIFRALGAASLAGGPLREAALVFVESGTDLNRDLLTDAFRDAAESFRNQLKTVEGHALDTGAHQVELIFTNARKVFQSEALMRAFDLPPAPKNDDWPLGGALKGDGTQLATELIRMLDGGNFSRTLLSGPRRDTAGSLEPKPLRFSMTQNKFILLQQVAWYGGLAISGTMNNAHQQDPLPLIDNTYKWTKALQRLVPDVVRVWKDPMYRVRLTDLEWGMVDPHPSDALRLGLGGHGAFGGITGLGVIGPYSTATVRGEVCCSTGDLPCPASSNCEVSPGEPSCAGFCLA
jgi:hypothetical protein